MNRLMYHESILFTQPITKNSQNESIHGSWESESTQHYFWSTAKLYELAWKPQPRVLLMLPQYSHTFPETNVLSFPGHWDIFFSGRCTDARNWLTHKWYVSGATGEFCIIQIASSVDCRVKANVGDAVMCPIDSDGVVRERARARGDDGEDREGKDNQKGREGGMNGRS